MVEGESGVEAMDDCEPVRRVGKRVK